MNPDFWLIDPLPYLPGVEIYSTAWWRRVSAAELKSRG